MKTSEFSLNTFRLSALCPLDGRYQNQIDDLHLVFSEYALIKYRLFVEINWLKKLIDILSCDNPIDIPPLTTKNRTYLDKILENFSLNNAEKIKFIEKEINHDTKAVEYFIRECIENKKDLACYSELIHCGCTSDDINNLAYALMLRDSCNKHFMPSLNAVIDELELLAKTNAEIPMLARTHGQPASPTTVGKELANFVARLKTQRQNLNNLTFKGKFNGATGNYSALTIAFPEYSWDIIAEEFVTKNLGLTFNAYTTQIEPHDYIAELAYMICHTNSILLGLSRDMWSYISLNYFSLKQREQDVGSSVMPHKINPIDFENAEGNLGLANSIWQHFAEKLPISRWQRDLSDSTVLRNLGMSFGYCLLAYKSLIRGLQKISVNQQQLNADLEQHWEVLAEVIQTVMRRYKIPNSYEQLKALTRGQKITKELLHAFIKKQTSLPCEVQENLLKLTPQNYIGLAGILAKNI